MEKEAIDPFKQMEYELNEKSFATYMKFNIALHYCIAKKYQEAYVVLV